MRFFIVDISNHFLLLLNHFLFYSILKYWSSIFSSSLLNKKYLHLIYSQGFNYNYSSSYTLGISLNFRTECLPTFWYHFPDNLSHVTFRMYKMSCSCVIESLLSRMAAPSTQLPKPKIWQSSRHPLLFLDLST